MSQQWAPRFNAFTTGNLFSATALLGYGIGRGFGVLNGFARRFGSVSYSCCWCTIINNRTCVRPATQKAARHDDTRITPQVFPRRLIKSRSSLLGLYTIIKINQVPKRLMNYTSNGQDMALYGFRYTTPGDPNERSAVVVSLYIWAFYRT